VHNRPVAKTIVITGASEGIGRALAERLARRGDNIVLAARGKEALEQAAKACEAAGGRALAVPTDVADPEACRVLIERAVERFGGIDTLVNNAGISMWARFEEITDLSTFDKLMRVNYLGAVYATHFALPHLKQRRGLLVAVSSLTGKTGVPTRSGYAASKHAMQGFFDSLRIELRGTGVDVLIVSPGFVATDIRARALGGDGAPRRVSPRDEEKETMPLETCIDLTVDGMDRRAREVVMTTRARLGLWIKLVAPSLVDRIAEYSIREKKH
jgi:short-subunit dehydrogenase